MALRHPVLVLLLWRLAEELSRRWATFQRLRLGRLQLLRQVDDVDSEIVQGCLLSLEHLLTMGRVEKRTVFVRPLLEVLGGNEYLRRELLLATQQCRVANSNCLVTRWLRPDERYHTLQASLNAMSALFGANFVHFNALNGETSDLFKSTWYCITVMTPTRPVDLQSDTSGAHRPRTTRTRSIAEMCSTFVDMSRKPRATLRIAIVNESELRCVADGKLVPPSWGFFNSRHAERFRMIKDFSENFQKQLVRTPADSRSASSRSPFTNEKAHAQYGHHHSKPDGGHIKRVHSQPNLAGSALLGSARNGKVNQIGGGKLQADGSPSPPPSHDSRRPSKPSLHGDAAPMVPAASGKETHECEENCFLRLHVPHYVGPAPTPRQVVIAGGSNSPEVLAALRKVSSAATLAGPQSGCLADGSSSPGGGEAVWAGRSIGTDSAATN